MTGAGRRAARSWAVADVRRRWRSLVALGLLAGVTAGLAIASLAGARRTNTAFGRLARTTNASHAVVFSSQVGAGQPRWRALRGRPEVETVAVWDLVFGEADGEPGAVLFASSDGTWLGDVNRPVVTEGRMFDPESSDEVVVAETLLDPVTIGQTFSFQPYGRGQDDTSGEAPNGPKVTMKVVGKVRTVNQFLFTPDQVFLPPGFMTRFGDRINIFENADVQVRDPAKDIAALRRDVNEVVAPGTPVLDLRAARRRIDTTLSVERTALLLLALAVVLAGGVLVGQALDRSAGTIGDDAAALRAVGMTRDDLALAGVLAHGPTIGAAVVAAFITALATSQVFPVGLGRKVDPDVGVHADWAVLGPGLLAVGIVVLGATILFAWSASRPGSDRRAGRPSRILTAIRRHAPLTVGLGASIALDPGTGRNRNAVRPALVAAIVAVLGIVCTLTIDRGIDESLAHPDRAGVVWDANVIPLGQELAAPLDRTLQRKVRADAPPGTEAAEADRAVIPVNGVGAPAFTLRPLADEIVEPIALALTSGRAPLRDDEAAVGPKTAEDIGVHLGDTVRVGAGRVPVRIVGTALFPSDVHSEFDEGLWLTAPTFDATALAGRYDQSRMIVLDFPRRTSTAAAVAHLGARLQGDVQAVGPAEVPTELTNLRNIRTLPVFLAGFLALVGIAALSHVLVTSARRRRHDFAVLRAIGLDRRATRLVLNAQGTAVGVVGLVLGVPLGIALGRVGWRLVSDRVPLTNVPPLALLGVVVIIPATVALANVLAVWPGRRVARLRAAEVLRTE